MMSARAASSPRAELARRVGRAVRGDPPPSGRGGGSPGPTTAEHGRADAERAPARTVGCDGRPGRRIGRRERRRGSRRWRRRDRRRRRARAVSPVTALSRRGLAGSRSPKYGVDGRARIGCEVGAVAVDDGHFVAGVGGEPLREAADVVIAGVLDDLLGQRGERTGVALRAPRSSASCSWRA